MGVKTRIGNYERPLMNIIKRKKGPDITVLDVFISGFSCYQLTKSFLRNAGGYFWTLYLFKSIKCVKLSLNEFK